ncbi:MAG TPA: hypothetical protein VD816_00755 [Ohtaekwangia sp.]|nr:hypothetical protein [Ohtaekwangia sp.]
MKKLIALIAVCGFALAFVACGAKKEEAGTQDSTTVESVEPAAPDTTSTTDTTGVAADTTAN